MKKTILSLSVFLLAALGTALAQEPDSLSVLREMNEIHDDSDTTMMLVRPMDTIDTPDKYVKIVLFNDHTWDYIELERPDIDTTGLFEDWDIESIHTYRDRIGGSAAGRYHPSFCRAFHRPSQFDFQDAEGPSA